MAREIGGSDEIVGRRDDRWRAQASLRGCASAPGGGRRHRWLETANPSTNLTRRLSCVTTASSSRCSITLYAAARCGDDRYQRQHDRKSWSTARSIRPVRSGQLIADRSLRSRDARRGAGPLQPPPLDADLSSIRRDGRARALMLARSPVVIGQFGPSSRKIPPRFRCPR